MEPFNNFSSISFTVEEVYQALLSLDTTKAPGIDLISPKILQSCAPILYQSLHDLFTMSLQYAHIPSARKVHQFSKQAIEPWSKTIDPSHYFQVLEWLVFNKVINHITNQLSIWLSKRASTLQQSLLFFDYLSNNPTQVGIIYLDIHKAFDIISHSVLLNYLGITGTLWSWFKCYLTNRVQQVSINNSLSDTHYQLYVEFLRRVCWAPYCFWCTWTISPLVYSSSLMTWNVLSD